MDRPGSYVTRRTGQARPVGEGAVEYFDETTTHNPWDDLAWLLKLRDDTVFYSGPDYQRLRQVIDEHIGRILAGHAGCGCDCAHTRGDNPRTEGHPRG